MKTKLEMAHDYLRDIVSNWEYDDSFNPVDEAWKLADAMQAEADKREPSGFPNVLRGACGEIVAVKVDDKEWQPDWSQAPDSLVKYFAVDEDGQGGWYITKPTLCSDHWYWSEWGERLNEYDHAPSFGYTGDWLNSLRKRPK